MLSNIEPGYQIPTHSNGRSIRGKMIVVIGDQEGVMQSTAALLLDRGAKVFYGASNASQLTATFRTLALTGGEWSGMVANFSDAEEASKFFDQAEERMGRIDAVVRPVNRSLIPVTGPLGIEIQAQCCIEEAIARMQARGQGQIITVGLGRAETGSGGIPAALRRQARELGIRVTFIEAGGLSSIDPSSGANPADEVARTIYESLLQPYPVDLVFLNGRDPGQFL